MNEFSTPADQVDFRTARSRAFLRSLVLQIRKQKHDLMAWDEVRDKLNLRGLIYRGVQEVPIEKIVGSVGRFKDFDDAFLPRNDKTKDRWAKINRAFYQDVSLPPVVLYKVGDVYFVLDGNHRVSVAREHGVAFIDAEVHEAHVRVKVTADDLNADTLELLGEYDDFLHRTHLHKLRPDQNIRFTIGGAYPRLIEHIAMHRYFMGLEQKRDISEDEAVADWYDNVYLPIVQAVREQNALELFPGRTEADLYLWVIDHKHYLQEDCDDCEDVTPSVAAADYAEKYAPPPKVNIMERVTGAVGGIIQSITDLVDDAPTEPMPAVHVEVGPEAAEMVWQGQSETEHGE